MTDKCPVCYSSQEAIEHITGGCRFLVDKQCTERHNNVATQIHSQSAIKYNVLDKTEPY